MPPLTEKSSVWCFSLSMWSWERSSWKVDGQAFPFREFKQVMSGWQKELEGKAWNSLFLGNHDQPRSVSRFGNDGPKVPEASAKCWLPAAYDAGNPLCIPGGGAGNDQLVRSRSLGTSEILKASMRFHELTGAGKATPEEYDALSPFAKQRQYLELPCSGTTAPMPVSRWESPGSW